MKSLKIMAIIIAIVSSSCTFKLLPQISNTALTENVSKIPVNVLLSLSEEFRDYEYVASYDGREIRYYFGKSVSAIFPEYISSLFISVRLYDSTKGICTDEFIATPSFVQSNSYVKPFVFGVETKIKVDFTSCDRKKVFSFSGKGVGTAGIYTEGALLDAGNEAINSSLIELRDKIIMKKEDFLSK